MSHIVDSLRKQQKMIILGAALAVITLYIIPLEQIVSAIHPGVQRAIDRVQDVRSRIGDNDNIPPNVQDKIDLALQAIQYRLRALSVNF